MGSVWFLCCVRPHDLFEINNELTINFECCFQFISSPIKSNFSHSQPDSYQKYWLIRSILCCKPTYLEVSQAREGCSKTWLEMSCADKSHCDITKFLWMV